jgi:hypothetical protein
MPPESIRFFGWNSYRTLYPEIQVEKDTTSKSQRILHEQSAGFMPLSPAFFPLIQDLPGETIPDS